MKKLIIIFLLFLSTQVMGQVKVIEQVNNNHHTLLIFLDGNLHQVEKYIKRRDELVAVGVWEVLNEKGDTIEKKVYRKGKLIKTSTYINGKWVSKRVGI